MSSSRVALHETWHAESVASIMGEARATHRVEGLDERHLRMGNPPQVTDVDAISPSPIRPTTPRPEGP